MLLPSVEKWRTIVNAVIDDLGVPLPSDLILAVIQRESRGNPGAVNPKSGASGLMQVMPIALKEYNSNHTQKYTMHDLRRTDAGGARIQIRIGSWILQRFIRGAYNYLRKRLGEVPLDDLIRVSDTFYAAGPGAAKSRLDKVDMPTWEAIKSQFPSWDRIIPAEKVWDIADSAKAWNLLALDKWLESKLILDKKKTMGGAILGLLIILWTWYYLKKKR